MAQTATLQSELNPLLFENTQWQLDPIHSTLHFGVRHMVGRVTGTFQAREGSLRLGTRDLSDSSLTVTIDAASVNTNTPDRDAHLRSADFFDAEKFPAIMFTSTKFVRTDEESFDVHGLLSMHGVTKPVVLKASDGGRTKDPWGGTRAGFHATTTVNRSDFELKWNVALEAGGVLVGEKVAITIDTEFVLQGQGTAN